MKIVRIIICAAALYSLLSGCGEESITIVETKTYTFGRDSLLVGNWKLYKYVQGNTTTNTSTIDGITFNSSGTYSDVAYLTTERGTWKTKGDSLYLDATNTVNKRSGTYTVNNQEFTFTRGSRTNYYSKID